MLAVLFAGYSCVQDTTEDLAPIISGANGEGGEVKTLQVSMPESSRTLLGEKADGKYPVEWSVDDVLAVNGKPTTAIKIDPNDEGDLSVAVFELPLGITIPYNIVYPYPGDDVAINAESGAYPVVFASEQRHTKGSFANGSAPMFAWSNGFDDIHMEHLATALRFSIKAKEGESVDLKYISVSTVDAEPISGVFDVYCDNIGENEAGAIVARADAKSTVFYNFDNDSYVLESGKVEDFFIAVPKGEYSRFEVSFVSQNGETCSETFDASGDKKLLGGKVREFPVIEFTPNSKMFLIGNDADMETFAIEAKAGSFDGDTPKFDGALLVQDVDMTGKEWTSIEGYASLFEGRNYKIKGLTAPLFGENTIATISNVNVEGAIVETTCGKVGMIARSLAVEGDKVGTIFNCSAEGTIEYKNESIVVNDNYDLINVGGVVGGVYGGSVTLSESKVSVTIATSAGAEAVDKVFTPCVGGVVGYACAAGEVLPVVADNTSYGEVVWDDASGSTKVTPYIGGVAGYVVAGVFADNVNNGELFIREAMHDLDWGGVIGASAVSVQRCENKGSLTINEAITKANIGGVLGKLDGETSVVDCVNSGELLFDTQFKITETCNIGGVVAYTTVGTEGVENCTNSGSITYLGTCNYIDKNSIMGNANIVLGGVVGITWSEKVLNCKNLDSAVLNIAGEVSGNGTKNTGEIAAIDKMTAIGGVIGIRAGKKAVLGLENDVTTENCSNGGNVTFAWEYCGKAYLFNSACIGVFDSDRAVACNNDGTITIKAQVSSDIYNHPKTGTVLLYIGGLFGCVSSNCDQIIDCKNTGTINVSETTTRMLYVSGLLGTAMYGVEMKLDGCANTGDIIVGEDVFARNIYVGGILASTNNIKMQYPNCYNSGNVESKATASQETYLGSIFGWSTKSNTDVATVGIYNSGTVTYSGNSALAYVGGYCGQYSEDKHTVQFNNTAEGVVTFAGSATFAAYVGGVVGVGGTVNMKASNGVVESVTGVSGNIGGEFAGMTNNGKVSIVGIAPKVYAGGCFGYAMVKEDDKGYRGGVSQLTNNGDVVVPASELTDYSESIYLGGVFGYANMGVDYPTAPNSIVSTECVHDCNNFGNIIYMGIARDGAYIGGIAGCAEKAPLFNCINEGVITSTGHAGDASPKLTESGDKAQTSGWAFNYKNHDLAIGGIVGETDLDMVDCTNKAQITHTCTMNPLKIDHNGDHSTSRFDIGGLVGRTFVPYSNGKQYALTLSNSHNEGAVTIFGSPAATNNMASIDLGDAAAWQWQDIDDNDRTDKRVFYRTNLGGMVGRMMDNSSANVKHYVSGCTNSATVSVPEAAGTRMFNIAGGVGELLISEGEFNNVKNSGKVSIEKAGVGTTINSAQRLDSYFIRMGGIVGFCFDCRIFAKSGNYCEVVTFNDCENSGDIFYGEVAASCYQCAGGILGQVLHYKGDWCIGSNHKKDGESYGGSGERYSLMHIDFNRCKNSGNINYLSTATNLSVGYNFNYAGGILGAGNMGNRTSMTCSQQFNNLELTFDHCENSGELQWDRNNTVRSTNASAFYTAVGGILGYYCGGVGFNSASTASTTVYGSHGAVSTQNALNARLTSCKNSGRIWGFSGFTGGIVGLGLWYITITGTENDPTINTGDIVVKRESGKVVRNNRYGDKPIYAGGIAGGLSEYINAAYAVGSSSANPAYSQYNPEYQYARVEYAVNEGAVGGTAYAGGIVGYYYSAVEASKEIQNATSRGGMQYCRNTGEVYALEGATTNVGALVGTPRMLDYTASSGNDLATKLSEKSWPVGVSNCYVGGYILRGSVDEIAVDETNYMRAIYGNTWDLEYISTDATLPYDGCVYYVPAPEVPEQGGEGGEGGEGEEPEPEPEPAARR